MPTRYHSVAGRRELAVRAALGAGPASLIASSMRLAVVLTAIGIAVGLSIGAYLTRFIESQMYSVQVSNTRTIAGVAIAVMVTAAAGAYYPARRAVNADPMHVLRDE